jgi:NTP pyrophosphatase (non-canonical NTP hydrolase)
MTDETTTVAELRRRVADFVSAREWEIYHDPKNLSMSIAIEAAELMEHFQWARNEELAELLRDEKRRQQVGEEVSDVVCFLLALVNVLDLDLSSAVDRKLAKNAVKYPVEEFRGRYFKPEGEDAGS